MHPRYIDPFTDSSFKFLFGRRKNKHLLIAFLNALLRGKKVIKTLIYLDKEQLGLSTEDRKSVFDVYCEDENGDRFIIEIQRKTVKHLSNRAVFYSAYPILEQGVKGEWDHALKEVYAIWILDFVFPDSDPGKMVHEVKLVETDTGKVFDNCLTYLYIESPKFMKEEHQLETALDRWLYVLTNLTRLDKIPVSLSEDLVFKDFFMVAEFLRMTHEEKEIYLLSLKEKWDEHSIRQAGIEDGRVEGKAESRTDFARAMIQNNEPYEKICKYTGLSIEEIQEL